MSEAFQVFVVDDDPLVLDIMGAILDADCAVTSFDSAEACRPRLDAGNPGMLLLDVDLPGIDGYAFCRQIKDDAGLARIPVTFVSSHDTIEARLAGYDAGGEDFIVKPFEPEEVLRKVRVAQEIARNKRLLTEQAEAAEYLSSLALASMDEAGLVLQFMSQLIAWDNEQDIATGLIELMRRYRLDGAVQTRVAGRAMTFSAAGIDLPLETSVLNHVSRLERIFEFRNRGVHNFERVTLMVNNMPLTDPDFCGRLRDNLSIAAQGADSRLLAIETEEVKHRSQAGILEAMESIRVSIATLRQARQRDRAASTELMQELDANLVKAFVHLGMTDRQERHLENMVGDFMRRLIELLDRGEAEYLALRDLGEQLARLR